MEHNVKVLEPEQLIPQLLEILEVTEPVPLRISGGSMTPFLANGRDTVYLSKVRRPLQRGDMVLYCRDSGNYVLHRVYRVEGDTCTMVGDAQTCLEQGIRPDQILAVVTAVRRKGKLQLKGSFWWEFFENVWIRMVPLRHAVMTGYALMKKLFG